MSSHWFPGSTGPGPGQQWSNTQAPTTNSSQQYQNPGWAQGTDQWQPMQQAPVHPQQPITSSQLYYGQPFPGGPGQPRPGGPGQPLPRGPGQPRPGGPGQPFPGGPGQPLPGGPGQPLPGGPGQPSAGGPGQPIPGQPQREVFHQQQQPQFHHPQQPMNQHLYILEQQRLAREEQRLRNIEIQKRKMRTMNIAGAKDANSSIDDLIGRTNLVELSPASQRRSNVPKPVLSSSPNTLPKQPQMKPRAWTVDSSNFERMFAQHNPLTQHQDDSFGQFQAGVGVAIGAQALQPIQTDSGYNQKQYSGSKVSVGVLPQYVSGVGVNPTHSYTHPILATSISQVSTLVGKVGGQQQARGIDLLSNGSSSRPLTPPVSLYSTSENNVPHLHKDTGPPAGEGSGKLNPSSFPPIYMDIYRRCSDKDGISLSTELLFPVLMSSQLPKSLLGKLWQVANRGTPGKLNQTELFVLLGLIGLVQAGNPSPTFEDLQSAPVPPVPVLKALPDHKRGAMSLSGVSNQHTVRPASVQKVKGAQAPPFEPGSVQKVKDALATPLIDEFGSFQQGQLSLTDFTSLSSLTTLSTTVPSTLSDPTPSIPTSTSALSISNSTLPGSKLTPPISTLAASTPNTNVALVSSVGVSSHPLPAPITARDVKPTDKYDAFNMLRTTTDTAVAVTSLADFESFARAAQKQEPVDILSVGGGHVASVTQSSATSSNQGWADFSSAYVPASTATLPTLIDTPTLSVGGTQSLDPLGPSKLTSQIAPPSVLPSSLKASREEAPNKATLEDLNPLADTRPTNNSGTRPTNSSGTRPTTNSGTRPTNSSGTRPTTNSGTRHTNSSGTRPTTNSGTKPTNSSGTTSSGPLSLNVFEPAPTESPTPTKRLTGFDILNEEITVRFLSGSSDQQAVPLDTTPIVPEAVEEFSDFKGYPGGSTAGRQVNSSVNRHEDMSAIESNVPGLKSDPCKVWRMCLKRSSEVLESCAAVFGTVEERALLEEISQLDDGRNKLRGIVEVYRLANRIYSSLQNIDPAVKSADYAINISRQWHSLVAALPDGVMVQLYSEVTATDDTQTDDVLSDSISKCSLCLFRKNVSISSALSLDGRKESYSLPLLFHEGQTYHASCANFWTNIIQEELPVLN